MLPLQKREFWAAIAGDVEGLEVERDRPADPGVSREG
jgi:hypothetical protein